MPVFIQVIIGLLRLAGLFIVGHWQFFIVTAVVVLGGRALFYHQVWMKPKRGRWLKFLIIYHKWPARKFARPKLAPMMQELIDRALEDLAYRYLTACGNEQELSREYPQNAPNRNVKADMRDMKKLSAKVYTTKHAFWRAHQVAAHYGFTVRKRAKDYCVAAQFNNVREADAPLYVVMPASA